EHDGRTLLPIGRRMTDERDAGGNEVVCCLRSLRSAFGVDRGDRWVNLASILAKLGRVETLARPSLIPPPDLGIVDRRIDVQSLADDAAVACHAWSAASPWLWRTGEYDDRLAAAYHNLAQRLAALPIRTRESGPDLINALQKWWAFRTSEPLDASS